MIKNNKIICDCCQREINENNIITFKINKEKTHACKYCISQSIDRYHDNDMKFCEKFYMLEEEEETIEENQYFGFELELESTNYNYNEIEKRLRQFCTENDINKIKNEKLLGTYLFSMANIGGFFARTLLKDFGVVVEYDGSLDDGIEIITAPFTQKYGKKYEKKIQKALSILEALGFSPSSRTGLHIHTTKQSYMNNNFYKNLWIPIISNQLDIDTFFGRKPNNYNKDLMSKKDKVSKIEILDELRYSFSERYSRINVSNDYTIEYRCFASTLIAKKINMYIDFIQNCLERAKENKKFTTLKSLISKRYYEFLDIPEMSNRKVMYVTKKQEMDMLEKQIIEQISNCCERSEILEELNLRDIYTNNYINKLIYKKYKKGKIENKKLTQEIENMQDFIYSVLGI